MIDETALAEKTRELRIMEANLEGLLADVRAACASLESIALDAGAAPPDAATGAPMSDARRAEIHGACMPTAARLLLGANPITEAIEPPEANV